MPSKEYGEQIVLGEQAVPVGDGEHEKPFVRCARSAGGVEALTPSLCVQLGKALSACARTRFLIHARGERF